MESINYKINGGGEYGWDCYGLDTFCLDSNSQKGSISIVYDTETQIVYEMSVCDYTNNAAYRWISPSFVEKHKKESKKRSANFAQAWDDVDFNTVNASKIIEFAKKISKKK